MRKITDEQLKFIVRYWDDFSAKEFAKALNISECTISRYAKIFRDNSVGKLCPLPPTKKE